MDWPVSLSPRRLAPSPEVGSAVPTALQDKKWRNSREKKNGGKEGNERVEHECGAGRGEDDGAVRRGEDDG